VRTDSTAVAAFYARNASKLFLTGAPIYFDTATGNGSTGDGTAGAPYASWNKAVRSTYGLSSVVYGAGNVECSSTATLRENDGSQWTGGFAGSGTYTPTAKHVKCWPGKRLRFYLTGDDISAATYTATTGYAGMYETTLATTNKVYSVTRKGVVDAEGFAERFHVYASKDALLAAGSGFYFNAGAKTLYLMAGGTSISTIKAELRAYYTTSGGLARVYQTNTSLLIEGAFFDGPCLRVQTITPVAAPGIQQAETWLVNCTLFKGNTTGVQTEGALAITENCTIHAPDGDAILYNGPSLDDPSYLSLGVCVNGRHTLPGDTHTGNQTVTNANGISAHGGSNHAAFGVYTSGGYGPSFRDINSIASTTNTSWFVSCIAASPDPASGLAFSFTPDGASAVREAYIDSCFSFDASVTDLQVAISGSATSKAHLFGCNFATFDGLGVVDFYPRSNPA
jgi:hypothetical protein